MPPGAVTLSHPGCQRPRSARRDNVPVLAPARAPWLLGKSGLPAGKGSSSSGEQGPGCSSQVAALDLLLLSLS